jgi:uncharacterized protein Yka (UPF0111/DUF47 family)
MSVTIEQDLKDYLDQKFSNFERRFEEKFDKIDQRFDKIEQKIDKIDERLNKIEIGQARLEAELKGELKRVEEKIDGLDKRLGFQEFINRGVLIGFISAILGGLAKVFGFIPNP